MATDPIRPGRLVLGAAQFGQSYGNGVDREPPDNAVAAEILRTALDGGVDEIDTARAYGASESAIGQALGTIGPAGDRLRIVTKVRPLDDISVDDDPATAEHAIRASIRTSLEQLRRANVDALLLHRARDLTVAGGTAVTTLDALVSEGTAARWGVSVGSVDDLLAACATPGVGYVQLPFNLLDRRWLAEPVQQALRERRDIRIVVRSVLLQGLLSSDDPRRWPAIPGVDASATQSAMTRLVAELGRLDPLDLAIGYVLGHPWVDAVVLGVRRPAQLADILTATSAAPLSAEGIELVHRTIDGGPHDLVDPSRWSAYPKTS
ncbi:aldo/keto reductase [Nakamurella lactea]|uniref:aldo/keto reductase n=1 Tax=Nakamurella lactea TaxID=459515 RepID=UPI00040E851D|nr:aldo/keto reductase [Nakamurella lactea]